MTLYIFTLRDHKMRRVYILYTKLGPLAPKLGLLTPKLTLGDPFPTGPQHKYGDSLLSHSAGIEILSRRCPSSTCNTATLAVHCVAACLACSTNCSVASAALSAYIFYCIFCRLANFPLMVAVRTYASSSQGPNLALSTASLHCVVSTCSFSAFASCSFANLCVMVTVRAIVLTSSYFSYSSLACVSSRCTLGSSCGLVTSSSYYSKSEVQSFTMASTAATASLTDPRAVL